MNSFDVLILGAGGAGMMCAIEAGSRGRRVLLIDHAAKIGGKILISGGGRCNFTNTGASPAQYVSNNPHFCKSALSRFKPEAFIERVRAHNIRFHEKKLGQLFCDESAKQIVEMLQADCLAVGAKFALGCKVESVSRRLKAEGPSSSSRGLFVVTTSQGVFTGESLVIATGGLSIPKIGASGLGYDLARQFGLKIVETAPALDGFTFADVQARSLSDLSGVSVDCSITCHGASFRENVLFTHSGLSGPAALQASLYWRPGDPIVMDLFPDSTEEDGVFQWFMKKKKEGNRSLVKNLLGERLPARLAERLCALYFSSSATSSLPLPQVSEKELQVFCALLRAWTLTPSGTVGYGKAEVTRGGVDTDELSSKTMESKKIPGLYFIGEVVDVTGWLGGYNFQWAWASGWSAGQVA